MVSLSTVKPLLCGHLADRDFPYKISKSAVKPYFDLLYLVLFGELTVKEVSLCSDRFTGGLLPREKSSSHQNYVVVKTGLCSQQ